MPPLFCQEGPEFYDDAFAHNEPFAVAGPYQTTLVEPAETEFRDWVALYSVPFDPDADPVDYDMRGYWLDVGGTSTTPVYNAGDHFPDAFKTPYDTSFSKESIYATLDCPFEWHGSDPEQLYDTRDWSVVFGPCATTPREGSRFGEFPLSRIIVTNLTTETITILDRLATNISATHTHNAPFEISFEVPSDNPEVNLPRSAYDEDIPFIDEGITLVYWFLRFGNALSNSDGPWECVGAGLVMNAEDSADNEGNPVSRFTAYDGWKMLYRAPCLEAEGRTPEGILYLDGTQANDIIEEQLLTLFDEYPDLNTHLMIGTMDDTDPINGDTEVAPGTSIGELFDQLVKTGTVDIWITPVYDPVNKPGITGIINCGPHRGEHHPEAIFSWDMWPHSLVGITREQDGEERANKIQFYAGQGGPPSIEEEDGDSQDKYGIYFEQQSFPAAKNIYLVRQISARELTLRSKGRFSYTMTPAAERAPIPFKEYNLGDTVPVYASKRFRKRISNDQTGFEPELMRIQSIPITVGEDQLARVQSILISNDLQL